jgi:hypothetical protein
VNNNEYFNSFIKNNKNITHLSLIFVANTNTIIDLNIGVISHLSQLISLQIQCFDGFIELKSLTDYIKLFSVKCLKLKSLSLSYREIKDLNNNDFMSYLKNFPELKRFELRFSRYSGNFTEFEEYFINSLKTGFKNLTHLTIIIINETFLENIAICLPNLQNLIIKNHIRVTKRTASILSRLSKLETLELNIINKSLRNSLKNKVIKKCRKIRSIQIN